MKLPVEIIYWDILPAIRRKIVLNLKEEGLKQIDIANLVEITPSAVSLYLKKKRGEDITFSSKVEEEIKNSSLKIMEHESKIFNELNRIIKHIELEKDICKICKRKNILPENCKICNI